MIRKQIGRFLFSFSLFFSLASLIHAAPINTLLRGSNDPIAGNRQGTVTVVEFFDYQCGHCSSMAPVISAIIKSNPNIRVVFKDLPIRGPISEFAARAALAANKQGKYYPFSHALLTANQPLTQNVIFEIAKSVGLNVTQLKKDMNSSSIRNQIKTTLSLAQQLQLTGTPAFFISRTNANDMSNVNFILGETSQNELQNAINQAGR